MKILRRLIASGVVIVLSACTGGSPMRVAMTELGTVSDSEYGAYGLRMVRSINVTGLGPEEVVGTLTTDPDKWSAKEQFARFFSGRSDLPDSMTPRLTEGQSFVVQRRFCNLVNGPSSSTQCGESVTLRELTQLRDNLVVSQSEIALAMRGEVKAAALTAVLHAAQGASQTQIDTLLRSLQSIYPSDDFSDLTKVKAALKVTEENGTRLSEALAKIRSLTAKSGVFVTRWDKEVEVSGGATAGDAASLSGNSRKKISGFLILGDPQITSLHLGDDLLERKSIEQPRPGSAGVFKEHRNYIAYYQLRARYVLHAESQEDVLSMAIQADISKIMQTLKAAGGHVDLAALQAISLKVQALYAALIAASGTGVLDAQAGDLQYWDFSVAPGKIAEYHKKERDRARGTLPVITIRASFDDFLNQRQKISQGSGTDSR
ncbi:hypothetical protein [Paracidovorax valerianellae]|uniref:Uncharacterized protein n=1 Tax=Paracidovorax valerianellae TaxID=187868 RepID=A0A1G7EY20_9BURK|nr:hypothetical protein [Paracidovorax valerianellae]MDA8448040.1 hypothetical protein [Paracidovorax valerianellae]SDE68610.1 hypothetical protein SAMN05192589_12527 [Paracidovorax valerianellae]